MQGMTPVFVLPKLQLVHVKNILGSTDVTIFSLGTE
mgnify:CR=1 FL=1